MRKNRGGGRAKIVLTIAALACLPACSVGNIVSQNNAENLPHLGASIKETDTNSVGGLIGKWRYLREISNTEEAASHKRPGSLTPPRAWEIHFLPDHFDEIIDNDFGIAAHYTGTYVYSGGELWLREPWHREAHKLKANLSPDRLTIKDELRGWTISFERSDEPIQYLSSLPPVPRSLAEAVRVLKTKLKAEDLKEISHMKEEDLIRLHMGLGLYIRNAFDLWRGNSELMSACGAQHPDDASMTIIQSLWKTLRE